MTDTDVEVRLVTIGDAGLAPHTEAWHQVEEAPATLSPYLRLAWLDAWWQSYRPDKCAVIRIERQGSILGLGLVETHRGRLRFGGFPVSGDRGLLCRAGAEDIAWSAMWRWARENRRSWVALDGEGIAPDVVPSVRARLVQMTVPTFDLPPTFDDYLAARTPSARKALKQKLRRLEREGGEVRLATDVGAALDSFVRLHQRRAAEKSEKHPQIDECLKRMLLDLSTRAGVELEVLELVVGDRRLGVAIHFHVEDRVFFYNSGVDTSIPSLSPGIVLELEAIRRAIARRDRCFDLGAGEYGYKTDLGGVSQLRYRLLATSATPRGYVALGIEIARDAIRSHSRLHAAAQGILAVNRSFSGRGVSTQAREAS